MWCKLGLVYSVNHNSEWMYSHAMIPIAEHIHGDIYRIYFSSRDTQNRSHGAFVEIDINNPTRILAISDQPILSPGRLGCFDDSGALPNSIVHVNNEKYLYYTGINLGVTVKIRNSIGLAKWSKNDNKFIRCFEGPVIDRTRNYPHFVATPEVHYENGLYRAWFTSCVRWEKQVPDAKHYYHLEYAESNDGYNWSDNRVVALTFQDEYEYAFGVPRVIKDNDSYKMWFCSRASKDTDTYRIGYAISSNGIQWKRYDQVAGLNVSKNGWDSQMVCYPYVFDHNGKRYMLYNGNGYGLTGFGIAVWCE